MIQNIGYNLSAVVATVMMVGVSIVPTMLLQWKGRKWHGRQEPNAGDL